MIKNFVNYILVLMVLLSCVCFNAKAQDIEARAKLEETTIRIGDQTKLHLSVEQLRKDKVAFPVLADTLTGKVEVVSSSKLDTIPDKNNVNRITVTKSIVITGFDAGTYTIPPFVFKNGTDVIKTDEVTLFVQTVKVDTTKAIYDIKQPLAVSYSFMDWLRDNWQGLLAAVVVIALIAGAIYYYKKRKKNQPVEVIPKPVIPVHTIALNKLKELRDKKLWQQDEIKLHYIELSDVIREYLEKRYDIKTHEKTTDEIFAGLKKVNMTEENKLTLHEILTTADLVKFAKGKPSAVENEQYMDSAINFVIKTQQIEKIAAAEGGDASEHA